MNWPNFLVVLGTLMIAGGGFIATYGWNAKTEYAQRERLIKAITAELVINLSAIRDRKFAETDKSKLAEFVIFPRMKTVTLEGAIASGLFRREKDREFLTRVSRVHELLISFNQRLSFMEDRMVNDPTHISVYREKLREGATRKQVLIHLIAFAKLLKSEYGVRGDEELFVELKEDAE